MCRCGSRPVVSVVPRPSVRKRISAASLSRLASTEPFGRALFRGHRGKQARRLPDGGGVSGREVRLWEGKCMRKEVGKEGSGKGSGSVLAADARRCRRIRVGREAAGDEAVDSGAAARAIHDVSPGDVGAWLGRLRLGRAQERGGVVLVPLLEPTSEPLPSTEPGRSRAEGRRALDGDGAGAAAGAEDVACRDYRPMPEAMARGELLVMEVSPEGRVGEVLVVNRGTLPVLALEGEEWCGARQNRVLTESVLLRPGAVVRVPVVCSEPGRWSYPGRGMGTAMGDSGVCLPLDLRAALRAAGHRANVQPGDRAGDRAQEVVRCGLTGWQSRLGMGETMAEWQEREIRRWEGLEEAFAWVPGQVGWLAGVEGSWRSVEVVSRPAAWRRWHGKWLRNVLAGADPRGTHDGRQAPGTGTRWREEAMAVIGELAGGAGLRWPGVDMGENREWGHGTSCWVGAALVEGDEVLHAGWQRNGGRWDRWDRWDRERRRGAVPAKEVTARG